MGEMPKALQLSVKTNAMLRHLSHGYCIEQYLSYAHILVQMGFKVFW